MLYKQGGLKRVRANLQSRVKKGAMSQDACDKAMALLKGELTYDSFKVCIRMKCVLSPNEGDLMYS